MIAKREMKMRLDWKIRLDWIVQGICYGCIWDEKLKQDKESSLKKSKQKSKYILIYCTICDAYHEIEQKDWDKALKKDCCACNIV